MSMFRTQISRRAFGRQLTAVGGAAAATPLALAAWFSSSTSTQTSAADAKFPAPEFPIIDTHQHLWDLDRFRLPWLADAPEVLRRSYGPADYQAATEGLNVVQAVYMEVDVDPQQHDQEVKHISELCQSGQSVTKAAIVGGRPGTEGFADYVDRLTQHQPVKGIRQVLHGAGTPSGTCLRGEFIQSIQLLGRHNLSFDLCFRPTDLGDAVQLAKACPDTRFILDHCGNPDLQAWRSIPGSAKPPAHDAATWQRSIDQLAQLTNVSCKISGVTGSLPPGGGAELLAPAINHCLDAFGPQRVVFGGDWPVCLLGATYQQWLTMLSQIIADRPAADQKRLLHDNALTIYRLAD